MKSVTFIRALVLLLGLAMNGGIWARGGGHFGGSHYGGGFHGGYYGGNHYYGGGHHPHGYSGFGFYFGPTWGAWGWPYYSPPYSPYYYPYYAYPPAIVTVPASPPVYIEQKSVPEASTPQPGDWSYCENPEGYSPYIKDCPSGWQKIAPAPPQQESGYWYHCQRPQGYYPYVRDCPAGWSKRIPGPATPETSASP